MGDGGSGDGLEVGDAWAGDLGEVGAGAEHERAEDEVGEREDHIEVFVHVAVVEDVVAVEEAEETSFFRCGVVWGGACTSACIRRLRSRRRWRWHRRGRWPIGR